jgi:hypothetical protein
MRAVKRSVDFDCGKHCRITLQMTPCRWKMFLRSAWHVPAGATDHERQDLVFRISERCLHKPVSFNDMNWRVEHERAKTAFRPCCSA